jgi:hypothetical protein
MSKHFLSAPSLIHVGCVNEIRTCIEADINHPRGFLLIHWLAEGHCSQT